MTEHSAGRKLPPLPALIAGLALGRQRATPQQQPFFALTLLVVILLLALIIQRHMLGIQYPENRKAIIFIPLLGIVTAVRLVQ